MIKFFIFIFSFLILTQFKFDPDLGWHLATGFHFLETGEIVQKDIFTWTLPGYEWGNRYFVYQILVAFLLSHLGYVITTMIFGILGSLAVLLLIPKKLDFPKLVAVFLGIGVAVTNLGLRPHMISFLMFSFLLLLLERRFFLRKIHALFWFAFFALWANFHQAFFVGVLTFGAFIFCDFLWQISNNKKKRDYFLGVRIFNAVLAFAGGFLTPFNFRLWGSLVDDLLGAKTWTAIAEWKSIAIYPPWSLLYAVSGLVFVYILFKKFKDIEPVWFLLAAFIFMLPFLATNFVFFWAAIFIFLVSRHLEVEVNFKADLLAKIPILFSTFAGGVALVLGFFLGIFTSVDLDNRLRHDGYPVDAVNFLKKEGLSAGLFNSYAWGGYIEFAEVGTKVFIDGRMTGWRKPDGGYILADYLAILSGDCDLARKYDIKLVLMEVNFKNDCFSDFREVYQDPVAKVLVKN